MAKTQNSRYLMCLLTSLIANLWFGVNWYLGSEWNLSWSRKAAIEAEVAASVSCSGHGRAYLDGVVVNGKPTCECNTCYEGPDCSQHKTDCAADANSGNPYFLEPFWMKHATGSAVVVAGWHRMGYDFDDGSVISQELERHIRLLHSVVGNAITQGKYIVFGAGSTQLLNAAVHALSIDSSSAPASVVSSVPFYALYRMQTELFDSTLYDFQGDAAIWKNNSDTSRNIIEFVTSPNNPDGQMNKGVLHGQNNVKHIYDRAYYWPHFTPISAPDDDDEDLTIFTISKLTGHAGSRFGWALIKNKDVYETMTMYMALNTIGVSRDTQIRALKLLKVVLEDGGKEIFKFGHETMVARWERLRKTMSISNRFTLQNIPSGYCTYFHRVREATPAYAWVKCEWEGDVHCGAVLKAAKIVGRDGSIFEADDRYVRLSLIRSQDDFDDLINHLHKLVTKGGSIGNVNTGGQLLVDSLRHSI